MITEEDLNKPNWLTTTFALEGSVLLMILPRILVFCGLTLAVTLLYKLNYPIYLQKLGDLTTNVVYNLILGLLVVFRTNTSYERFWEGRKIWGSLSINIRNLAQEIQVICADSCETKSSESQTVIRWLEAFAIATKRHLRAEAFNSELDSLLTVDQVNHLKQSQNPPLDIVFWIRRWCQQQYKVGHLSDSQSSAINEKLNALVEGVSGCERIITTPIPLAYRVYLKRLILIYCIGLPFKTVPELTWWALPLVAVVSFLLLGIEEVGRELENPFGHGANDLPLDDICNSIQTYLNRFRSVE